MASQIVTSRIFQAVAMSPLASSSALGRHFTRRPSISGVEGAAVPWIVVVTAASAAAAAATTTAAGEVEAISQPISDHNDNPGSPREQYMEEHKRKRERRKPMAAGKEDTHSSFSPLRSATRMLWTHQHTRPLQLPVMTTAVAQCERSHNQEEPIPAAVPTATDRLRPRGEPFGYYHHGNAAATGSEIVGNECKEDEEDLFHGLFPRRQLWHPKVPYPLWDRNWDGQEPPSTGNKETDRAKMKHARKHGVTRHIILVRHGQYHEDEKDDENKTLTDLGRLQAELTGKRLREIIDAAVTEVEAEASTADSCSSSGNDSEDRVQLSCRIKCLRVSGMTRAKETADIIASYLPISDGSNSSGHLPTITYHDPDPSLSEGRPCHHIPGIRVSPKVVEVTDDNHRRIEGAFKKYFYRAPPPPLASPPTSQLPSPNVTAVPNGGANSAEPDGASSPPTAIGPPPSSLKAVADPSSVLGTSAPVPQPQRPSAPQDHHEFEIIVCHANVIRYFVCRALQLPPEAWLRFCPFNCSLTYLTIRPTGSVSCRLLGDIGHLPYRMATFSKHQGYNW